jgi:DcaP outer membrane protein
MKKLTWTILGLCIALGTAIAQESATEKKTTFSFGGFAKLDFMSTSFNNGAPGLDSPIRDIHLPSVIPIGGNRTFDTHFHVKESRFNFDLNTELNGKKVHTYIELDFLLSKQGDQRVSNSYSPRIRHFYFTYGKWTFGQTWSNFMNVIIPDDLDFAGAAEGIVFNRQPQVRYSTNNWHFALELPETTITPNGGGAFITSSGGIPDMTVRRTFSGDWGNMGVSVIARELRYYEANGDRHGTMGFGLSTGAKLNVGEKDDFRISATYGNGLGRYLALAFLNGAVIRDDLDLETINSFNGYASYLHHWNDKWRTSVNYSFLSADNNAVYTGQEANKGAMSLSANIINSPAPQLMFGVEMMYGYRELEGGTKGDFYRLQFSAKYSFKYTSK